MPLDTIVSVRAVQVLDSRGNPTVEVHVTTKAGFGAAGAPAGASKGSFEAVELRDGGKPFDGLGVCKAVAKVNGIIAKNLVGLHASHQQEIDGALVKLDGTPNMAVLGANATVATSIACAKAAASSVGVSVHEYLSCGARGVLPVPFCNVINGGMHAGNGLAFQEFMLAPTGARSFSEAVRAVVECSNALREKLIEKFGRSAVNVGDEGGFAPPLKSVRLAFELLHGAVEEAGWGKRVFLASDVAASRLFKGSTAFVEGKKYSRAAFVDYVVQLCRDFKIISVEDPFAENDFSAFAALAAAAPQLQVVGDDLFVSNVGRVRLGLKLKAGNALLVKPNQVGTLSGAVLGANTAYDSRWGVMCSHRSGETEDAFIAQLAFALGCGQLKAGATARGERTAKYNELLRIENSLGSRACYAGKNFRRPGKKLGVSFGG